MKYIPIANLPVVDFLTLASPYRDIYRQAAVELEADGWCQHIGGFSTGERCLTAKLSELAPRLSLPHIFDELWRKLGMSPQAYNDQAGMTKQRMVNKLRELSRLA